MLVTLLCLLLDRFTCTLCVSIGLDSVVMGGIVLINTGYVSLLVTKPDFVCLLDLKEFYSWLECTFDPVYCSLSVTNQVSTSLSNWEESLFMLYIDVYIC